MTVLNMCASLNISHSFLTRSSFSDPCTTGNSQGVSRRPFAYWPTWRICKACCNINSEYSYARVLLSLQRYSRESQLEDCGESVPSEFKQSGHKWLLRHTCGHSISLLPHLMWQRHDSILVSLYAPQPHSGKHSYPKLLISSCFELCLSVTTADVLFRSYLSLQICAEQ